MHTIVDSSESQRTGRKVLFVKRIFQVDDQEPVPLRRRLTPAIALIVAASQTLFLAHASTPGPDGAATAARQCTHCLTSSFVEMRKAGLGVVVGQTLNWGRGHYVGGIRLDTIGLFPVEAGAN
jgi:hypothetical protein